MGSARQKVDVVRLDEVTARLDDLLVPDVIDEVYDLWKRGEVDHLLPDLVQYIFRRASERRSFPRRYTMRSEHE